MTVPAQVSGGPFSLEVDYSNAAILARLPRGRHGLPQDFVDRNHRNRLLAAAIEAIAECGYPAVTVADITRHAAVSRGAFYRHFSDKEDCFLAAYDIAVEWLWERVEATIAATMGWAQGVANSVERLLDLLAADPRLARICTVEAFVVGPVAVARHEALIDRLAALLRRGSEEPTAGAALPPQLEEGLLGGAVSLVARYIHSERGEHLQELTPILVELLLSPYVGPDEARRLLAPA